MIKRLLAAIVVATLLPIAASAQSYSPSGAQVVNLRKGNAVLTNAALGASGVFTGAWIDTTLDNTSLVNIEAYSAVGAGTLAIQESNDISGTLASFPVTLASTSVAAAAVSRTEIQITARYWRVVYTNSTTAQTTFEIAYGSASISSSNRVFSIACDQGLVSPQVCASVGGIAAGTQGLNALTVRSICQAIAGTGGFGYPCTADQVAGSNYTVPNITPGGSLKTILTSASPTTCTSLETATHGRAVQINNASASAAAGAITIYDDTGTCASGDKLYSITLAGSQIVSLNVPLGVGLSYTLGATLTDNIVITRN